MLNLPRIGMMSRNIFYPCKLNPIPLLRSDYHYNKSTYMKNLHLYQFPKEKFHKFKRNLICDKRRSKVKEKKVTFTMNPLPACTAYPMATKTSDEANASDVKRQTKNDNNFGYLRTDEYKRISPEFLTILKHSSRAEEYITHKIEKFLDKKLQENWIKDNFRLTHANQDIEVNVKQDPTHLNVEVDQVATDVLKSKQESKQVWNPHINQYLKHLMEDGYINDNISIDHDYDNAQPHTGDELEVLNTKEILDPSKVIYLLSNLHKEGYIQPLQLMYLMGYLRAIVTLGAQKFNELLDKLNEANLLNEQILNYFEYIFSQINQDISNSKLNVIFRKLAQVRDDLISRSFKLPFERKVSRTPEKELNCNAQEIESNIGDHFKIDKIFSQANHKIKKETDYVYEEAEGQNATKNLEATQSWTQSLKKIEKISTSEPKPPSQEKKVIREVMKPLSPIARQIEKKAQGYNFTQQKLKSTPPQITDSKEQNKNEISIPKVAVDSKQKIDKYPKKEEESKASFGSENISAQTAKSSDKQQMLKDTKSDNAKNQTAKELTKKESTKEIQIYDVKDKGYERKPHEPKTKIIESSIEYKENKAYKLPNAKITPNRITTPSSRPERKSKGVIIRGSPITARKSHIKVEAIKELEQNKARNIKSYIRPSLPKDVKQTIQQKLPKHLERERKEKPSDKFANISDKKNLKTTSGKDGTQNKDVKPANIPVNLKDANKSVKLANIPVNLKEANKAVEIDLEKFLEQDGLLKMNGRAAEILNALNSKKTSDQYESDEVLEVEEMEQIDEKLPRESDQNQLKKDSEEMESTGNAISNRTDILEDYRRSIYNKLLLESETTENIPKDTNEAHQKQLKKSIEEEGMPTKKHKLSNILNLLRGAMQNIDKEIDKSSEVERLQRITKYTDNKFQKIPTTLQDNQQDKFEDISGVLKDIEHFNKKKQDESLEVDKIETAVENDLNNFDSNKDMKHIDKEKIASNIDIKFRHDKFAKHFRTAKSKRKKRKYLELKDLDRIDNKFKRVTQKYDDINDEINIKNKSLEAFMKFGEASESDFWKRSKRMIIPRNKIERILRDTTPQKRFNIAKSGYYEPINSKKFTKYKEIDLTPRKRTKERKNSLILQKKAYRPKIVLHINDEDEDEDDDDYEDERTVHTAQLRESAAFIKAPWKPESKMQLIKKLPMYLKTIKEFRSGNIDYTKSELDMDHMRKVARLSMGIRDSNNSELQTD